MKNKKFKIRVPFFTIAILIILAIIYRIYYPSKTPGPKLCYEQTCFQISIADTYESRQKWLMFQTSLDEDRWMLFVFENPSIHSFWMKNTLIPLDMIWMDSDYKVVYIQNQAQPCTADPCPNFNPWVPASYVLEINWWEAEKLWLKVWDQMKINGKR